MSTTCLLQEPKAITSFPQPSLLCTCDHDCYSDDYDDADNDDDCDDGVELILSKIENAIFIYGHI